MDIERLKTDPAYWDEVAPNGATHYNPKGPDGYWYDLSPGSVRRCWSERYKRWVDALGKDWFFASMTPRPSQPQWRGPEDGLPPAGTVCEVRYAGEWLRCTVVAHLKDLMGMTDAVFQAEYDWDFHQRPEMFRPLKSDKERAVEAALAQDCGPHDWMLSRLEFCARLYDAGLLHLPEGAD